MKPFLKKLWDHLEEYLVLITFTLVLLAVFLQVITREVFQTPISWTEESARFIYLWMIFLGASMITKQRKDICIELVKNLFKNKAKFIYDIFTNSISLLMFCFLFYYFIEYVQFSMAVRSTALEIPLGFVYLCAPIGMGLCIARSVELIIADIRELSGNKIKVPEVKIDSTAKQ